MKKLITAVLAIVMAISVCVPAFATDAPYAAADISGTSETYNIGDTVNIVLSVCDITFGEGNGISALEFQLYFDADKVEPVVTASTDTDGDNGDFGAFITKSPDGWEGFGRIISEKSCYDLAFSDLSFNGAVSLDGELVITVPFKVKNNVKGSDLVFTFDDVFAYDKDMQGDRCEIDVPAVVIEYSMTPDEIVTLPENAIAIDFAGYKDAAASLVFYANEDITVGDYVKKFIEPVQGQDNLSDFAMIIVDSLGVISETSFVVGKDKSEITIPKGSYIIAVHKDSEGFAAVVENADKGKIVELYNVNVEGTANVDGAIELSNVGFVIGDYAEGYVPEAGNLAVKPGTDGGFVLNGSIFVTYGHKVTLEDFKSMFENADFDILDKDGKVIAAGTIITTNMTIDVGTGIKIVMLGDVDCDGEIGAMDYILTKRIYFGMFSPDEIAKMAASLTNNENIVADDYIFMKRVYFGLMKLSNIYNNYWVE